MTAQQYVRNPTHLFCLNAVFCTIRLYNSWTTHEQHMGEHHEVQNQRQPHHWTEFDERPMSTQFAIQMLELVPRVSRVSTVIELIRT